MNTFSLNRFWITLKTNFLANKKQYLRIVLTSFIAMMASFLLISFDALIGGTFNAGHYEGIAGIIVVAFFVLLSISPSLIMKNYNTKEQRIGLFMLPASRLEKFLTQMILSIVVVILCFVAGVILFDLVQFVFFSIIRPGETQLVASQILKANLVKAGGLSTYEENLAVVLFFVMALWQMSLYLLGGVFFRRYAWLLTSAVLWFAFSIFMIVASRVIVNIGDIDFVDIYSASTILYVGIAIFALFTTLNVYASYKLFGRLQVINNKWFNW